MFFRRYIDLDTKLTSLEALELESRPESRPSCNNDAILHDLSNSSIFKREKVSYIPCLGRAG